MNILKVTTLLYAFCAYGILQQNNFIDEIAEVCYNETIDIKNIVADFRNIDGEIDWDWHKNDSFKALKLSSGFVNKYLFSAEEFILWKNYQMCYCDKYLILNDSLILAVISNRIMNNNQSNKYLVSFDFTGKLYSVLLISKIEKSIDDLFEVRSELNVDELKQFKILTFMEDDGIISDSIYNTIQTKDFINYIVTKSDSIRVHK